MGPSEEIAVQAVARVCQLMSEWGVEAASFLVRLQAMIRVE
jgi:hypothetical protein